MSKKTKRMIGDVEVRSNIPLPKTAAKLAMFDVVAEMKAGESFVVESEHLRQQASQMGLRYGGKIVTRKEKKGFRVWVIKPIVRGKR